MHSFIHSGPAETSVGGERDVQATVAHLDGANGREILGTVSLAPAVVFLDDLTLSF